MKKVCIIGAGASGLAAMRHVSESPYLDLVVFEQGDAIGGLWIYSDSIKNKMGEPVHSSMYNSLRTHLPKQLMGYPDFPFGPTEGSFLTHKEMLNYMNEYAASHKLMRYIQFKHRVISVNPTTPDADCKWLVTVENLATKTSTVEEFDSVIVCNGHCFKPFQPKIVNQELFNGQIMHSKDYRRPTRFSGMNTVLVIGSGLSGLDLATEIASTAKEVIFSNRGKSYEECWLPENVRQIGKVKEATENGGILFEDGTESQIDMIVFCTGFKYDYPFLPLDECEMEIVNGKYVKPLFRHFIHSKFTSLAFFGLSFLTAAFPLFDWQARFYTKLLEGKVKLPSEAEMNRQIEYDFNLKKNNGLGISESHSMENNPWGYCKTLGSEAGFPTNWIPFMKSIYNHVNERRDRFPTLYKFDKIIVKSQNEYEYVAIEETFNLEGFC